FLTHFFSAATHRCLSTDRGAPIKGAIIVAEDIHWADDESLDVLLHLARTCKAVPLLILCLARPALVERRPQWEQQFDSHETLKLEPLSRESSIALVESILRKAPQVPESLRELVISSAEG